VTRSTTLDTLTTTQVTAYLARIGVPRPPTPTASALAALQRAHLLAVPFENLDIALGRAISVEPTDTFDKVVNARRGGYCYELNGLFGALLRSLGYAVDQVSARVSVAGDELTPEFDHLALVVTSPYLDEPALADVGFGDAFIEPPPLRDGVERHEPGKDVGLALRDRIWQYRERPEGGQWHTQYVFTRSAHPLADFAERNRWQQTSPDSHFTQKSVVSRLTETGRVTLSGRRLITTTRGRRVQHELDEAAVTAALADRFGIVLHRPEGDGRSPDAKDGPTASASARRPSSR
jgi:N-hydroxyarylamine O-acetyltransferase